MISQKFQESFMIYIKASLVVGVVLASPWVFYQIWSFVAAGLVSAREALRPHVPARQRGLVSAGGGDGVLLRLPAGDEVPLRLQQLAGDRPDPADQRMGRVSCSCCRWASASAFQLPLVMLFLERIGVFTIEAYLSSWRMAILAIFVLVDGAHAQRRSVQHVPDGGSAHRCCTSAACCSAGILPRREEVGNRVESRESRAGERTPGNGRSRRTSQPVRLSTVHSRLFRSLRRRARRCGCGCNLPGGGRRSCRRRSRPRPRCGRRG